MRRILIKLIEAYQKIPGNFHNQCRYYPTCSNYAKQAIEIHGAFKGLYLSIKRVLKCNPLFKGGYDPVPVKEDWEEYEKNIDGVFDYFIIKWMF